MSFVDWLLVKTDSILEYSLSDWLELGLSLFVKLNLQVILPTSNKLRGGQGFKLLLSHKGIQYLRAHNQNFSILFVSDQVTLANTTAWQLLRFLTYLLLPLQFNVIVSKHLAWSNSQDLHCVHLYLLHLPPLKFSVRVHSVSVHFGRPGRALLDVDVLLDDQRPLQHNQQTTHVCSIAHYYLLPIEKADFRTFYHLFFFLSWYAFENLVYEGISLPAALLCILCQYRLENFSFHSAELNVEVSYQRTLMRCFFQTDNNPMVCNWHQYVWWIESSLTNLISPFINSQVRVHR